MTKREELTLAVSAVKYRQKNAEATLFRLYYKDLYEYIRGKVKYTTIAQDVAQDTFLEMFDTIGSLMDEDDFVRWSREIADRRCMSVVENQINLLTEGGSASHVPQSSHKRGFKSFFGKIIIGIVITVLIAGVREAIIDLKATQNMVNDETGDSPEEGDVTSKVSTSEGLQSESTEGEETDEEISENVTESPEVTETESSEVSKGETEAESTVEQTTETESTEAPAPETEATEPEPAEPFFVGDFQLISRGTYYEVIGVKERPEYINALPSEYEGLPVTVIAESAFEGRYVGSWTIPKSITFIGKNAFRRSYGSELIYVEEGNPAYYSANGECLIEKATNTVVMGRKVPSDVNLMHIGDYAYSGYCHEVEVVIPEGVLTIGKNAFEYSTNLWRIRIPSTIISIGKEAFIGSDRLTGFYYNGTIAQWNAITKGRDWDLYTGVYVIHCTDGDVWK